MKWDLVKRGGIGYIGFEIYRRRNDVQTISPVQERYFTKIFVYDTVLKLSGSPELILQKLSEVYDAVGACMEIVYRDAEDQKAMREIEQIQKEAELQQIEEALQYVDRKKEEQEAEQNIL